ncbi:methyltransferase domain-containing protein [Demequina sp.]|uniref:methyltransferase domain-containing protein n=1 Tax=Demequina sp. TaxID=2050685 RepID=UPI003A8BFE28
MEQPALPQAGRSTDSVQGHWLLARLGKRVLRPGGKELTLRLLDAARPANVDVVEFAPGLGITAGWLLERGVATYRGVDADADAAARVSAAVGDRGTCTVAEAANTGLESASADLVVGEAMLTMQTDRGKGAIIAEAARLLRPGGRYAIHELALTPDDVAQDVQDEVRKALATTIRVNARPLTLAEWTALLDAHGFEVEWTSTSPMALLEMRRNLADEGFARTARIVGNVIRDSDARRRVLAMRSVFRRYQANLAGIAIVATLKEKP